MQLDQNMLNTLAALDDTALIQAVRGIAAASGLTIDPSALTHENLDLLRTSLRGATEADLARAKEILGGKR
ncbi:MAG: hypothetical protein IJU41_08395 [Clostridia bacterium]|nr:hypothetical protein [Clostridia bacterium]